MNYYDILGVKKDADPSVIKAAYKALIQKYHPDKCINKADIKKYTEMTKIIIEAYGVLGDESKRKKYNESTMFSECGTSKSGGDGINSESDGGKNEPRHFISYCVIAILFISLLLRLNYLLTKSDQYIVYNNLYNFMVILSSAYIAYFIYKIKSHVYQVIKPVFRVLMLLSKVILYSAAISRILFRNNGLFEAIREIKNLFNSGVFNYSDNENHATSFSATRNNTNSCQSNIALCVTCQHWGGQRKLDSLATSVEYDYDSGGICFMEKPHVRIKYHAYWKCQNYLKWEAFRH